MKYKDIKLSLLGTKIHIKILHETPEILLETCVDLLNKYNMIFSMYDKNAELYKLNKLSSISPYKASDDLYNLIKISKYYSEYPSSSLNICIGPLVSLWDIGSEKATVPNENEIKDIKKNINIKNLILDDTNNTIFFNKENMKIDLGATAKGYIADKIMDYLKSKNVISGIVDLGGNILTTGFNLESNDLNWRIGLQYPNEKRGTHAMMLEVNDLSIVTSGIYERKLNYNGITYHHIFDSKTGYPINSEMESISIISKKSVDCDIWSSVLFGKDFEFIEKEVEKNDKIDVIAIYKNDIIRYTKGVEKYILWKDKK